MIFEAKLLYSGKLSWEEISTNFTLNCRLFARIFSTKVDPVFAGFQQMSLAKILQFAKTFSHESFPLYSSLLYNIELAIVIQAIKADFIEIKKMQGWQ